MVLPPDDLPNDIATLKAMLLAMRAEAGAQALMIEKLTAQLAKLRRMQFGKSSEKLDAAILQLELALGEIEEDVAAAQAEQAKLVPEKPAAPATPDKTGAKPKDKPVRKPLPAHLPREEVTHWPASVADGNLECGCAGCGGKLRQLGQDETEVLERVTNFKVIKHIRPKIVCRTCEAIVQAPMPPLPIERGKPGPGLLAHVLISKYADHLPLYRQSVIFARSGIDLDRSTLADWAGSAASLLAPLAEAIGKQVMAGNTIHADDTPVPVLAPGTGKTATGRLWVYIRDERPWAGAGPPAALYRYTPDRKGEHVLAELKTFKGFLHADGYAGFSKLYEPDSKGIIAITEVACMAHVRRKFFDVHAASRSPLAAGALQQIAGLYQIEEGVRGKTPEERQLARQAEAVPLLAALRLWMDTTLTKLSGKSELAKAIRYALSRWPALTRYSGNGRLEIDNNAAERAIRPLALGRKNWLFAGSAAGGERAATLYTIIETAKLCGHDPEAYLRDILNRIAAHPINKIAELLPWNWKTA